MGIILDPRQNFLQTSQHALSRNPTYAQSSIHIIQLHHTHSTGSQQSKKPLCSEIYDEIVFTQRDVPNHRLRNISTGSWRQREIWARMT